MPSKTKLSIMRLDGLAHGIYFVDDIEEDVIYGIEKINPEMWGYAP